MGEIADALNAVVTEKPPGCVIIQRLLEMDLRTDLDAADKTAVRAAIENRKISVRALIGASGKFHLGISRDSLEKHRNHGDCTDESWLAR